MERKDTEGASEPRFERASKASFPSYGDAAAARSRLWRQLGHSDTPAPGAILFDSRTARLRIKARSDGTFDLLEYRAVRPATAEKKGGAGRPRGA